MFKYFYILGIVLILCTVSGCSRTVKKKSEIDTIKNNYLTGIQKLEKNDMEGAETDFKRTVELGKRSPEGFTGMALLELSRSEYKLAMKMVKKALKYGPDFVDAHIARGRIIAIQKKGKWLDDALTSFEHVFELDPGNEKALYFCAECYLDNFAFTEALNYFDLAAKKQGTFKDLAAAKHRMVTKIIEADPLTVEGKERTLANKIDRSDLCVLLVEELKIKQLLKYYRNMLFEDIYNNNFTLRKRRLTVPPDVSIHKYRRWIADIIPLHIPDLDVLPDGYFYPDRAVSRAQLAIVVQGIIAMLKNDPGMSVQNIWYESEFPDVHSDYYAVNAIMLCVRNGIMETDSSTGKFRPDDMVSGAEAVLTIRNLEAALE